MKRFWSVIFCLTAVTTGGFSQTRPITESQYQAVQQSASEKAEKILRRVLRETTTYKSNKIETVESSNIETFPNGDERWNSTTKKDGQVIDTFQLIHLGKYEYRKEGDVKWTKTCFKDCSASDSSGPRYGLPGGKELPKVQEFFVSDRDISGQQGLFYLFYRVYQLGPVLQFYERRSWVDSNGLLIKEESTTSEAFPSIKTSKETVTYEYNPKDILPIEPPIK